MQYRPQAHRCASWTCLRASDRSLSLPSLCLPKLDDLRLKIVRPVQRPNATLPPCTLARGQCLRLFVLARTARATRAHPQPSPNGRRFAVCSSAGRCLLFPTPSCLRLSIAHRHADIRFRFLASVVALDSQPEQPACTCRLQVSTAYPRQWTASDEMFHRVLVFFRAYSSTPHTVVRGEHRAQQRRFAIHKPAWGLCPRVALWGYALASPRPLSPHSRTVEPSENGQEKNRGVKFFVSSFQLSRTMKSRKHQQRKNFLRDFCTKIQKYDFAVLGPVVTFRRFDLSIPKTKSEKFETAHEKRLSQNPSHGSSPYAPRLSGVFCPKPCAKAYSGKSLVLQGFPGFRSRFVGRCTKTEGATCAYLQFNISRQPLNPIPPAVAVALVRFSFALATVLCYCSTPLLHHPTFSTCAFSSLPPPFINPTSTAFTSSQHSNFSVDVDVDVAVAVAVASVVVVLLLFHSLCCCFRLLVVVVASR